MSDVGASQFEAEGAPRPERSVTQQIANEMVRLYKEQFGRGPTRVRADFANADLLIVSLEETLTPAERSMVRMGEHQRLRDVRLFFQHASEPEFRSIIERLTGRKVRGFVSGLDTKADIATEIFYLHPADGRTDDGSALDGV
jgi:uncharacterized protein YbcI